MIHQNRPEPGRRSSRGPRARGAAWGARRFVGGLLVVPPVV